VVSPPLTRALTAELIGTFAVVFAGASAVMVDAKTEALGHVGVAISFALVITVMIYALGHISGAHINPAVSLAFALSRHFPWSRVAAYWLAQVAGAVLAAAIAIGGTVGLDAMFGGPISGASMNPARSVGPALVSGDRRAAWIYLTAPFLGAALGALAYQFVRGEETRPAELHVSRESA
jgi:aquaporin NIP